MLTTGRGTETTADSLFWFVWFYPKSVFYQKLWHFSSRLQREGRMLSPAHLLPGGSGCPPGPPRTTTGTLSTDLLHLLLGLAAVFLLLRLYPRHTTFPGLKGTAWSHRDFSHLLPITAFYASSYCLLLPSCSHAWEMGR